MPRAIISSVLSMIALGLAAPLYAEPAATQRVPAPSTTSPSAINEKAKPPHSVFDSLTPPKDNGEEFDSFLGEEQFAWDCKKKEWRSIFGQHWVVVYVRLSDVTGTIGYMHISGLDKTFYRWKNVVISTDTKLFENDALRDNVLEIEKDHLTVEEVDPPIQFYKDSLGKFHPCYYVPGRAFVWKDIVVPETQIPKKNLQHRWPVLEPGKPKGLQFKVYEIDTPEHFAPLVKEWIVKLAKST